MRKIEKDWGILSNFRKKDILLVPVPIGQQISISFVLYDQEFWKSNARTPLITMSWYLLLKQ